MLDDAIDWESDESHVLGNALIQEAIPELLEKAPFPGHIWVSTSGSSGTKKWVGLSKKAFLTSAQAINKRLGITKNSRYLNVLPNFHVAGLAILARMHLADGDLVECKVNGKWDFELFLEHLKNNAPTHISLVPAQVFDIVQAQIRSPGSLEAVLVGGGFIDTKLLEQADALGWPLLPSFAMTETASTIAISSQFNKISLSPLEHVELKVDVDSRLQIKTEALLTAYFVDNQFIDPKNQGWFLTEDKVQIEGNFLKIEGRGSDFVKIGAESVNVGDLKKIFTSVAMGHSAHQNCALVVLPDERLGSRLHAAFTFDGEIQRAIVDEFNSKVRPFEKIRGVGFIEAIPKSSLGKTQEALLQKRCLEICR